MRVEGSVLVNYKKELFSILDKIIGIQCTEGAKLTATLVQHLLRALTITHALDYRSSTKDWNLPFDQQLPVRVSLLIESTQVTFYLDFSLNIEVFEF